MSLYLDLLPAPQFDRSLAAYTVANFTRIKDLLVRASGRTYVYTAQTNGPWPKTFTVKVPFKADILYTFHASAYAPAIGMISLQPTFDGAVTNNWAYMFENIANAHMPFSSAVVLRSVSAADHTFGVTVGANTTSDANDYFTCSLMMTEV